jgi:OmpA-OmpF porin, OOP family
MKKIALVALLAAFAAPAMAEGLYVVGSVGQSKADVDKNELDGSARSLAGFHSSVDDTDTAYKLQLGYQVNQYFAVEGGYINFGKTTYHASAPGQTGSSESKAEGVNLDAVGILPVTDRLSVFAKAGAVYAKVKYSYAVHTGLGDSTGSADSTDLKGTWGVGASFDVTKNLAIRAEYEQFHKLGNKDKTGEANVDLMSAGVVYKF